MARELFRPIKPWQIRLLCIGPAERHSDPLVCQLRIADMIYFEGVVLSDSQDNVTYDALSYAWGSPDFTHPLIVNDIIYPITANLSNALRALRHPKQKYHLWVDAVCINQHDNDERSCQVRHMIAIFRKARSVIAWLGLKEECGYSAIDYLQEENREIAANEHQDECMFGLREIHKGLQELCKRPWLRRTWVRQEVFVARDLWVRSGDTAVQWSRFLRLPTVLGSIKEQLQSRRFSVFDLGPLADVTQLRQGTLEEIAITSAPASKARHIHIADTTDITTVLSASSHFDATDPRDYVYGVLGMTDTMTGSKADNSPISRHVEPLPVDYGKSVSEVFQDVVKYLINRDGSLDVLMRAHGPRGPDLKLPSWTPDWRYVQDWVEKVVQGPCRLYGAWTLHHFFDQASVSDLKESDNPPRPMFEDLFLSRHSPYENLLRADRQGEDDIGVLRVTGFVLCQITDPADTVGSYRKEGIGLKALPFQKQSHQATPHVDPIDIVRNWMLSDTRLTECFLPSTARDGDLLVYLRGSAYDVVLRPKGAETHEFIGFADWDQNLGRLHRVSASYMERALQHEATKRFVLV